MHRGKYVKRGKKSLPTKVRGNCILNIDSIGTYSPSSSAGRPRPGLQYYICWLKENVSNIRYPRNDE